MQNLGLLSGNVKGDVTVNITIDPYSIFLLFLAVIGLVVFGLAASKIIG